MGVKVENISYRYPGSEEGAMAFGITDVSFEAETGSTIGIIGHTGSGKSTLVQHLNGLYLPQKGRIIIGDTVIDKDSKNLRDLRRRVGLVFQYPEDQLFEESVFLDIAFGPKNMGLSGEALEEAVNRAMTDMELDLELQKRSPYELSGGQKRKVAIATVLSMEPEILILDEPTAGLDPKSKEDLLKLLFRMKEKRNLTVFFVSHNMDDIFRFCDRVLVMNYGKVVMDGTPRDIYSQGEALSRLGLGVPFTMEVQKLLHSQGLYKGPMEPMTLEALAGIMAEEAKGRAHA